LRAGESSRTLPSQKRRGPCERERVRELFRLRSVGAAGRRRARLEPAGCSTAGPFVTNISSDGKGGIIIEKTYVQYNSFMVTVTNKDSSTTRIKWACSISSVT
jgi:hypothetical protein